MKKLILISMVLLISNYTFGQVAKSKIYDGKKIPYPSVINLFNWVDYSLTTWKNEMNKFEFSKNGIGEDGQSYFSITSKNGTYRLERHPSKRIRIIHTYYDDKAYFDEFVNEIEPYYVKSNKGGLVEYGINIEDYNYRFIVMRTSSMEIIDVQKFKIK